MLILHPCVLKVVIKIAEEAFMNQSLINKLILSILIIISSNVFALSASPTFPICLTDINGVVEQILDRPECVSKRIDIKPEFYMYSGYQIDSDIEQFKNLVMKSDPRSFQQDKSSINFNLYLHAINVFNSSDLRVKDFKFNKEKSFKYTHVFLTHFYKCDMGNEELRSIYEDSVWLDFNESSEDTFTKIFNEFMRHCYSS